MRASATLHASTPLGGRRALRLPVLLASLLVSATSLLAPAAADVVSNDIVSHNGTEFTAPGVAVVIEYAIWPTVNDKEVGCNAADGTPATLSIVPSDAAVHATPSSLVFTACGAAQAVSLVSDAPGNYRIDLGIADANPLGSYDWHGAEFTLHVVAPEAPPVVPEAIDADGPAFAIDAPGPTEAASAAGAVVEYSWSASDPAGVAWADCSPASGTTFPLGWTTVTCTGADALGNLGSISFDVLVRDTTPPALTLPADPVAEATGPDGAAVGYSAGALDLVDGAVAVQCDPASGATFPLGWTTVACSATDAAGNAAQGSFQVHVQDTTAPDLAAPANLWLGATSGAGASATYDVRGHDLVSGDVAADCSPASGAFFALGNTTVTCTATDAAGNVAGPVSFTVGVHMLCEGPLAPLKMDGRTAFKLGSTVPIKCKPYGASAGVGDATIRLSLKQLNTASPTGDLAAGSTSAADTGNVMRWDPVGQQYIYNLATKTLSKGTWQVTMDLGGGDAKTFLLGLR